MKGLVISLVVLGALGITFILGVFGGGGSIGLSMLGFCGAPFALIALGWNLHASGIRLSLRTEQPVSRRAAAINPNGKSFAASRLAQYKKEEL